MVEAIVPILIGTILGVFLLKRKWTKLKLHISVRGKEKEIIIFPLEHNLILYTLICLLVFMLIAENANTQFNFYEYIQGQLEASSFIEEHYVKPEKDLIVFPEQKRNLIWIYMESAETTFQDVPSGGMMNQNLIPEMTALAKENISFSQTDEISGAAVAPACGWTIAGLVAQTSGLPLKLFTFDEKKRIMQ